MYVLDKHKFLIKRALPLLMLLLIVTSVGFGQTRFTDGKIVYSIKVKSKGAMSPMAVAAVEKGKVIFDFKGHLFRSEMQVGKMDYVNIHNSNDHTGLSLIKGGQGKNYLIKLTSENLRNEAKKYKGMTYVPQSGTTKIAGYTCHKALGKLANGKTFVVFYTKELLPPFADYTPRFKNLGGIPLRFVVNTRSNAKLVMTATKVATTFQPSSLFATPTSGYRELTYAQLQKLRHSK